MLRSWLRSLTRRSSRPAIRPVFRPRLEALEDRLAPATHTWTGGAGAGNPYWSVAANWSGGVPFGDPNATLVFAPAANEISVNNYNGLTINSVSFTATGYSVQGNAFFLGGANGISASLAGSPNVIAAPVNLIGAVEGPPVFYPFSVATGANLDLAGTITDSGLGAGLSLTGAGTHTLGGANTFHGGVDLNGGTLDLGTNTALGTGDLSVVSGAPTILSTGGPRTLANNVTLFGTVNYLPSLTFGGSYNLTFTGVFNATGGQNSLVQTNTGTVTLTNPNNANIYATTVNAGTLRAGASGALSLGTRMTVAAGARLDLGVYGGTFTSLSGNGTVFVVGGQMFVGPNSSTFGGTITGSGNEQIAFIGGTVTLTGHSDFHSTLPSPDLLIIGGATLRMGTANALPHDASVSTYAGGPYGTLDLNNFNTMIGSLDSEGYVRLGTATLTVGGNNRSTTYFGQISGTGGLTKVGTGTLILQPFSLSEVAVNTYTGPTTITGGTVRVGNVRAIPPGTALTVGSGSTFDLNGINAIIGSLSGAPNAALTLGSGTLTTNGNNAFTDYEGTITGSGGLVKTGTGGLLLDGNDTYSGPTVIQAGYISVNGNLVNSLITVASGGFLAGGGTVGTMTVNGEVQADGPAILHATGTASFNAGSDFGVTLNPTGFGSGIGEFVSSAPVNLTGSPALHVFYGLPDPIGTSYTVIQSSARITGTFDGLPDNTVFTSFTGGKPLRIHYTADAVILTVTPSAADHISLSAPTTVTAGVPFPITVTVQDRFNNPVPNYTGTVHFTASNGTMADYTFQPADHGQHTLNIAVRQAGTLDITASDAAGGISGSTSLTVLPAAASTFVVSGFPSQVTAGDNSNQVTVTAHDPFDNVATGYNGTVHFTSSDGQAALPADAPLTNGTGTFPVTLFTAGSQSLTATDTVTGSITGTQPGITVTPAAADHLLFLQPPTDTPAGQTINSVIVAIVDAFGNVLTGDNTDTVTLSLGVDPSGGTATLSGTLTVTVVNGMATFSDLSIDTSGAGYTLHATIGGGLPDIDSNPFNIL